IDRQKNKAPLTSEDANPRRSAATDLGMLGKPVAIPWLEQAAVREPNHWVRYTMEEAAQLLKLGSEDPSTKIAAATKLGELRSQNALPALKELLSGSSTGSEQGDQQKAIARAASGAIERIEMLASMPLSFLVAGLFGLFLEATVIRFLYGRPLETLLATWGVSLIMIQAARVYFGDLTSVVAPSWLSGGAQVMVGVYLPYNRLFIIALSTLCVVGIYLLLFRSGVG